eukprot:m.562393 g.562393  ORF g.562393 m.562393 type:complete len:111 (+) comp22222_c0_seq1:125-457(+)
MDHFNHTNITVSTMRVEQERKLSSLEDFKRSMSPISQLLDRTSAASAHGGTASMRGDIDRPDALLTLSDGDILTLVVLAVKRIFTMPVRATHAVYGRLVGPAPVVQQRHR